MKTTLQPPEDSTPPQSPQENRSPLKNGNRQGDPSKSPRCGAKARSGEPCRAPAVRRKDGRYTRCRMHGGASTGPRTEQGRSNIARANFKHGRDSKEAKKHRRYLNNYEQLVRMELEQKAEMLDLEKRLHAALLSGNDKELQACCEPLLKFLTEMHRAIDEMLCYVDDKKLKKRRPDSFMLALQAGQKGLGCEKFLEVLTKGNMPNTEKGERPWHHS